jgi:ATP-dependent Clp protease ATP-binding subunit ClpA
MKDSLISTLRDTLRPELINRLDDIVIFRSLNREDAKKIVSILVSHLNKRLKDIGIKVNVNDRIIEYIVKEGFSDEYGARPLRRMLQDNIENVLANYILENGDGEGEKKIVEVNLDIVNNKIKIIK